jgi:hypothetical protein
MRCPITIVRMEPYMVILQQGHITPAEVCIMIMLPSPMPKVLKLNTNTVELLIFH